MHGHRPRAASTPRSAGRGDEPFPAFTFVRPLAGTARADEPRRARLRRGMLCVDQTSSSEGSRCPFGRRSPSSNQFCAPQSSCEHCYERRILSRVLLAPGVHSARTRGEPPLGLRFLHRPAKGGAFHENRGAFCRRAPGRSRGLLPVFIRSGPLFHAAPVPRRTPTLCRLREPAPL
jgi:hypothetical protein